jgi:iron complex outermembrane receptor protein
MAIHPANQLAIGGGLRTSHDRIDNRGLLFTPASRTLNWANLFAQDEMAVGAGVRLTGGVRLEHNPYTGLETLPSVRLAWSPATDALLWSAASRTVRAPSRLERDLAWPRTTTAGPGAGVLANIMDASDAFVSETARVLELGYRVQPNGTNAGSLAWSATLFYSDYDRLRTLEPGTGTSGGATFLNLGHGIARGLELSTRWQVTPTWRLDGGAVVQRIATGVDTGGHDAGVPDALATADPTHYWTLRSANNLSGRVTLDAALRHVGSLAQPAVPAYTELDMRFAWRVSYRVELALSGHNLLHASHREYGTVAAAAASDATSRTVLATANVHF